MKINQLDFHARTLFHPGTSSVCYGALRSTSATVGKDEAAPRCVTLIAALLLAKFIASVTDVDFARAAAKPPIKQSPAPVASTAFNL
jgi:hypothetical protein